jgi:hypothetical protein
MSHVRMGTSPSGQDDTQMEDFSKDVDWFIRGIFNKDGRAEFSIWFYKQGIAYNDVQWCINYGDSTAWEKEILEHYTDYVDKKFYTTAYPKSSYLAHGGASPSFPCEGGRGTFGFQGPVIEGTAEAATRHEAVERTADSGVSRHSKGSIDDSIDESHIRRKVTVYP